MHESFELPFKCVLEPLISYRLVVERNLSWYVDKNCSFILEHNFYVVSFLGSVNINNKIFLVDQIAGGYLKMLTHSSRIHFLFKTSSHKTFSWKLTFTLLSQLPPSVSFVRFLLAREIDVSCIFEIPSPKTVN